MTAFVLLLLAFPAAAQNSGSGNSSAPSGSNSAKATSGPDMKQMEFEKWHQDAGPGGSAFVDRVQIVSNGWKWPFPRHDFNKWETFRHSGEVEDMKEEIQRLDQLQQGSPEWQRQLQKVMRGGHELLNDSRQLGQESPGLKEMNDTIQMVAAQMQGEMAQHFPSGANGGSSGPPLSGISSLWGGFDAQQAIMSGADSLNRGDLAGSQRSAAAAIAADPTNPQGYLLSAMAAAQRNDYAAAASAAQAALDIDPGNEQAQVVLGLTQNRTSGGGDGAGAGAGGQSAAGSQRGAQISGAGSSAQLMPSGAAAGGRFGDEDVASELRLRDYKSAERSATSVLAANPNDARAYYLRSVSRLGQTDFPGALQDANSGLALAPNSNPLLDAKADALNRLAMYKDALGASSTSLELDPKDAQAYYNRGISLFGLRDRGGSVDALRQAAAISPAYQPVADKAAAAPSDADLSLLLPEGGSPSAGAAPVSSSEKARRFGVVALFSLLGGLLIALGLIQFLMEPIKSAFTKITRRRASSFGKTMWISPLARDGSPGLLRGQYQVVRQIGIGGMGVVYEGRDVSLERKVAVKRMREELRRDPRERQRFLGEAKLVAALHHPNIVDIYAIVEEGDDVYLVFEHIAGRTVHEILAANGRLSFDYSLGVLRGVASALDFAHARGIIHRDLKPSNVMVDEEGRPRVMDFGIARAAKDALTRQVMTNTVMGTPPYMAPEQEQGVVGREADLYALGVCLYEMLSGRMPFAGTGAGMLLNKMNNAFSPLSQMTASLPPGLDAVIAKALSPDPAKRFSSAKRLVEALDALRGTSVC